MFADDTTLTVRGKSSQDLSLAMNHDLNNVNVWLMANTLVHKFFSSNIF